MTLMVRSGRQGKMNAARWLLLAAFLVLGVLSHTAVAQEPIEVTVLPDGSAPPETLPPTSAPVMDRQADDEQPTGAPTDDGEPLEPTVVPDDGEPVEPTAVPDDGEPVEPTAVPDPEEPTASPTESPSIEDVITGRPTTESPAGEVVPTRAPTEVPAEDATDEPTDAPDDDQAVPDSEPPTEAPTETTVEETDAPTEIVETDSPSETISESPSTSPSEPETAIPTVTITSAPSDEPSPVPSIDVEDPVSVIIMPVSEKMSEGNTKHFENTAEAFLSKYLSQMEQPIFNVSVDVTGENMINRRQVRRLQESSMQVNMTVAGSFDPVEGMAETAEGLSIGQVSEQLFDVQGKKFVEMLKDTNNTDDAAYFASVNSVQSVSAENPAPPPPTNEQPADNGGLSVGVIVAIALVGALVASLVAVFVYKRRHAPNDDRRTESNGSSRQSSQNQSRPIASSVRQSEATSKKLREASGASARPQVSPPVRAIGGPAAPVVLTRVDSDIQSDLQSGWGAEESMLGGGSNMSYAYSLEDGINATMSEYSEANYPVPSEIGRTSTFESDRNDENDLFDIGTPFEANSQTILREITAPPGKLGLVLTTSDRGPVVQQVTAGSPLEGMVWPGDVIVSIDSIKTKKMSADQMTEYMTTNLFKKRKLTVLSDGKA